jgi:hypothetical protein
MDGGSQMSCFEKVEIHKITFHRITLKNSSLDGISRLHLWCKDCHRTICMNGDLKDYREDQIIETEYGGER